jgi:hypothetical protein
MWYSAPLLPRANASSRPSRLISTAGELVMMPPSEAQPVH